MKTVELHRHSIKLGPGNTDLSPAGIELAQEVGARELRNRKYTHLFESPLKRSQETLSEFSKSAGDFPNVVPELFPPHMEVSETEEGMRLWSGACQRAEQKHKDMLQGALEEEPELTRSISQKAAASFRNWLKTMPDNSHTLVVGHSPFLELIALGLFDETLPQLQPCEGFQIVEDETGYKLHTFSKEGD